MRIGSVMGVEAPILKINLFIWRERVRWVERSGGVGVERWYKNSTNLIWARCVYVDVDRDASPFNQVALSKGSLFESLVIAEKVPGILLSMMIRMRVRVRVSERGLPYCLFPRLLYSSKSCLYIHG